MRPGATAPTADSNPIHILVVDDEPSTRVLLKRWIERSLAARVTEACNGLQALEAVAGGGVEMIVSDINMPVLNGIEMLRLLQSDPQRKRMEVLVASQVSNEEKVRQAIELGVSDYLLKPLQQERVVPRLTSAAERIYDRRRQLAAQGSAPRTRVLVFDSDPNYCDFAESALSADFSIETARTVAEALVKALRFRPDILLFGADPATQNVRLLLDRIAALPAVDPPRIYQLSSEAEGIFAGGVDGTIPRSFVPETLRSQIYGLLHGGAVPEHGVLAWASSLKDVVRTALFQTLGMLTGVEPETLAEAPEAQTGGAYGWIVIDAADGQFSLRLDIEAGPGLAAGLAAAMTGQEQPSGDSAAPPLDALQEVLSVVAGRLKSACLERQIDVQVGLPAGGFEPPPERRPVFEHAEWFRWNGGEPFRVRYDAMPSSGKAPEA